MRTRLTSPLALLVALAGIVTWQAFRDEGDSAAAAPSMPALADPGAILPVRCPADPITLVLFGQSLSANSGEHVHGGVAAPVYAFHGGRCYPLRDPLPGATGQGGSIGVPLAETLNRALGRPIVLIAGGINGSSIQWWIAPESPILRALLDRIALARAQGLRPDLYIWMQGEADTGPSTTARAYARNLAELHAHMPSAPWIVTSNSICTGHPRRSRTLDEARRIFAARTAGIHLGADIDALGPAFRQADHCHLLGTGQVEAARRIAAVAIRVLRPTP